MLSLISNIGLFAADAPANSPASNPGDLIKLVGWMALMAFVFYFIAIRPQSQKAKQHAELIKGLRSGDKVVTSGGLLGVVLNVKDKTVSLRSGDSKLELQKGAVSEVLERGSEASQS
jgi:preprotein translocase subunit YajC